MDRCQMWCNGCFVSWKTLRFHSFQIFQRRNPNESVHALLITWQWNLPCRQLQMVSVILSLFLSVCLNSCSKLLHSCCTIGQEFRRCFVVSISAWQKEHREGPIIPCFCRFSQVKILLWLTNHKKYSTLGQCFNTQTFFHRGRISYWACWDWI